MGIEVDRRHVSTLNPCEPQASWVARPVRYFSRSLGRRLMPLPLPERLLTFNENEHHYHQPIQPFRIFFFSRQGIQGSTEIVLSSDAPLHQPQGRQRGHTLVSSLLRRNLVGKCSPTTNDACSKASTCRLYTSGVIITSVGSHRYRALHRHHGADRLNDIFCSVDAIAR